MMRPVGRAPHLRLLCAALVAVIAGVHFQQYIAFMSAVPTVGPLFLLNAAGGTGLVLSLLSGERVLRLLAIGGSLGLAIGSLVSIGIALEGNFLGYSEPSLRPAIVIAIAAEAAVIPLLLISLSRHRPARRGGLARHQPPPSTASE
jgi:hypothetical protein